MTYPQPREGIHGTDMADSWLLSLDEQAIPHREALLNLALHLRTAIMVGNPAPVVRRMGDRMRHPQPGDLACSTDVLYRRDPDDRLKGLGIFLGEREEWATTDAEWRSFCNHERAHWAGDPDADEMTALTTSLDNRARDRAYYLQYGPSAADICRWTNSEAMMIPVTAGSFSIPAGKTEGTSVVFTRNSLIAGLADSGFELRDPRKGSDE